VIKERGNGEGIAGKENNPSLFITTTIPGMTVIYHYVDSCHIAILKRYPIAKN
jgi:hypothetical protein